MEKVIFPMKVVSISQLSYGGVSHMGFEAIDIVGTNNGIEPAYAPTTCKVLKKLNSSGTVLFGTCDKNGNKTSVLCADGVARILTFALTHDNDVNDITEGQVFNQLEKFYDEGEAGNVTGKHIHVEIAVGWVYTKSTKRYEPRDSEYPNHAYTLDGPLLSPEKIFYMLKNFNTVGGRFGLNGISMPIIDFSNTDLDIQPDETNVPISGYAFRDNYLKSDIPNGINVSHIYIGGKFNIIDLYKWKASDGYRWGWAKFNGREGYLKYDQSKMFLFGKPIKPLFMILDKSPARLREIPLGKIIKVINTNEKIMILDISYEVSGDGYRWCKGLHNGTVGYFQYDPAVMYPTTEY